MILQTHAFLLNVLNVLNDGSFMRSNVFAYLDNLDSIFIILSAVFILPVIMLAAGRAKGILDATAKLVGIAAVGTIVDKNWIDPNDDKDKDKDDKDKGKGKDKTEDKIEDKTEDKNVNKDVKVDENENENKQSDKSTLKEEGSNGDDSNSEK